MRLFWTLPLLACSLLLPRDAALALGPALAAQPVPGAAEQPAQRPKPEQKIVTLSMHNARLRQAAEMLFGGSGLNVTVDPSVSDVPITLVVKEQPLGTALRMPVRIAAAQVPGLTYTANQGLYLIKIRGGAASAGGGTRGPGGRGVRRVPLGEDPAELHRRDSGHGAREGHAGAGDR